MWNHSAWDSHLQHQMNYISSLIFFRKIIDSLHVTVVNCRLTMR